MLRTPETSRAALADSLERVARAIRTGNLSSISDWDINGVAFEMLEAMHPVTACEFIGSFLHYAPEVVERIRAGGAA